MRGRETVWLVGMMGVGKSTVGCELARRLGVPFRDTDAEIERTSGLSVAEIFAREGEAAFRERERAAIDACCGEAAVVALGGGAIAQPGAREKLASGGRVVYLRARPASLLERVGAGVGRPLLESVEPAARLARLEALLKQRAPCYESADVAVDTDGLAVAAVVDAVERALEGPSGAGRA